MRIKNILMIGLSTLILIVVGISAVMTQQPVQLTSEQQREVSEIDKAIDRLKKKLVAQRNRAYERRLSAQRLLFRDYLQYRQMIDESERYEAWAKQTEAAIADLSERRDQIINTAAKQQQAAARQAAAQQQKQQQQQQAPQQQPPPQQQQQSQSPAQQ